MRNLDSVAAAMADIRERYECDCSESVPTRREVGAARMVQVWLQCVRCGRGIRSIPKAGHDVDTLPAFDADKRDGWWQQKQEETRALSGQWLGGARGEITGQSAEWWAKYSAYLRSAKWRHLRALVLERDGNLCQACLSVKAVHVHHLTYELFNTVGASAAFECVAICRRCHDKIHPEMSKAQEERAA